MMLRRLLATAALAVTLGGAALAPAMAQSNNPDFYVINRGSVALNEVYVSSSRNSNWGNDRLGTNVLAPGARVMISLPANQCVNDVKVVFADGNTIERRAQNTCEITEMMFP